MHIYGEGLMAKLVVVGAQEGYKAGNPDCSASRYTVFLGAAGVSYDFMSEESFGGSAWRGRNFLNGSRGGVRYLFNLELNERFGERESGKLSINCLLEVYFDVFQRPVIRFCVSG